MIDCEHIHLDRDNFEDVYIVMRYYLILAMAKLRDGGVDAKRLADKIEKLLDGISGENKEENEMTDSSKFFSNINCEYFPCHTGVDADSFNCMFCYCPLYGMFDCPGSPKFLPNGVKDCSNCTLPHIDINYDAVITKLKEVLQALKP